MNDTYQQCLKTEVAVECAAGVAGFIFRNYKLNNIPLPPDIEEIYIRNSAHSQDLFPFRSVEEIEEVLEQIKRDREYVKTHTPLPHR